MSAGRDRSVTGNGAADLATRFPALPAGRHRLPPDFVKRYQKERLAAAAAAVFHERGLGALTATRIIRAARVSNKTFYDFFSNKEECLSFAYEVGFEHLFEPVEAAYAGPGSWTERLGAALAALLDGLAEEPALADLCLANAPGDSVGGQPPRRALEVLAGMLGEGREAADAENRGLGAPKLSEEILAAGMLALIAQRLGAGEVAAPQELVAELLEVAVAPFFGIEEAEDLSGQLRVSVVKSCTAKG